MGSWIASRTAQRAAEDFLARHATLHDLLVAGGEVLEVVVQDEYTHDVVARVANTIAVFDST
ncbi:MAG: hypothetical protein RIT81_25855 [Deltaproteobacteria bacterium]